MQDSFNSEAQFEAALIELLQRWQWSAEVIKYPTETDLIKNWADILFENNRDRDRLGDYPLTDTEMQQLIEQINTLKTPLAINKWLTFGETQIKRDNPDDVEHLGKEVTLYIFDPKAVAGGPSRYQIAEQPQFPTAHPLARDRRGDLMLLVNGMPLFHIELKKSDVPVSHATEQIMKYAREGIFSQGLFSLVQIFVAMNPEETLYFANPGPEGTFNPDFFFHWGDFDNKPINKWYEVTRDLLSIPMAHQLIGSYTVPDTKDGILKVMRSYQYFATSAITNKVATHVWGEDSCLGGFVWHTTGSGKTMTSFKAAQLIANSSTADKVVFLMDRIELGNQSLDEYRGFANDNDSIEDTANTAELLSKLQSNEKGLKLIVTSIQKMSNIYEHKPGVDGGYTQQELDPIRRKRVVFIIDECHRSVFGDMLTTIKNTFPRALFFGFTGTPIDDPNQIKGMTTQDLFGERLHLYSIADGIRDENVLAFDPYMCPTFDEQDLRKKVALNICKAKDEDEVFADEEKKRKYYEILALPMASTDKDDEGRWRKGIEDYIPRSQYNTPEHRAEVVKDIKREFRTRSYGGKYHAMLATSSIPQAIEYYRLLKAEYPELRITAIFDPSDAEGEGGEVKEEALKEIIGDYNARYQCEFAIPTWAAFKKDATRRLAHKEQHKRVPPEKQLDLVIVVDQLLTGFDSKFVNTLYLDKVLQYEGLIQAFSRTNRVYKKQEKPFGIIRYYRYPNIMRRNIDEAFRLYAHGRPQGIFVSKICHNVNGMNLSFEEIKTLFDNAGIEAFASLPEDRAMRGRFAKEWKNLNAYLEAARMQGFVWKKKRYKCKLDDGRNTTATIIFDERTYNTLALRYKELFTQSGGSGTGNSGNTPAVPYEIVPHLMVIDTSKLDYEYLNSRFERFVTALYAEEDEATVEKLRDELHRSFASLSAEQQKYANIFLHDLQQGHVEIEKSRNLTDYITEYQANAKNDQIHRFATAVGINENKLRKLVDMHLTEDNINTFGHLDDLMSTLDKDCACQFFSEREGRDVPLRKATIKARLFVENFITKGGFSLDEERN